MKKNLILAAFAATVAMSAPALAERASADFNLVQTDATEYSQVADLGGSERVADAGNSGSERIADAGNSGSERIADAGNSGSERIADAGGSDSQHFG